MKTATEGAGKFGQEQTEILPREALTFTPRNSYYKFTASYWFRHGAFQEAVLDPVGHNSYD